ncbi:HNH endonuclease [Paramicrobacterium agarici]|nr:HNH endonuclease [Microbacterium agarici]
MQSTEWRPVPGYEDRYEVSNDGQVRSTSAVRNGGKVLKPWRGSQGYLQVALHKDLRQTTFSVHTLVALAFHGGPVVRHLNGDQTDNRVENISWGTQKQNTHDTVDHGHHANSKKTHCKRGHEYTTENTLVEIGANGRPKRKCRECIRIWNREGYQRRRANTSGTTP